MMTIWKFVVIVVIVAIFQEVRGTNIALNKDTQQSSIWRNSGSWFAVDGYPSIRDVNGEWGCSHLLYDGDRGWWAVDLGDVYDVERVVVRGRDDTCCRDRFSNINVDVLMPAACNKCVCDKWELFHDGITSKCFYSPGISLPITQDKVCNPGTRGRFVKVYRTNTSIAGAQNLCEVEVYGTLANITAEELGGTCSNVGSTVECQDENAACTSSTKTNTNTCKCRYCYYDNDFNDQNIGGQCYKKKNIGEDCSSPGNAAECFDDNAVCTTEQSSAKCRCKVGFYDTDLDDDNMGGSCKMLGKPDNKGTEFIIAFMDNRVGAGQLLKLIIMTDYATAVDVVVSSPGWTNPAINERFSITSHSSKEISIHINLRLNGNEKQKKGILISSTKEVIVHGVNTQTHSTDMFLCFPTDVLSKEYYTVTAYSETSQLAVVGVKDETTVSITFGTCNSCGQVTFEGTTYSKNGSPLTVYLDKYEVIHLQSDGDFTGTFITSDKKVSVFSGNELAKVGSGYSVDHLLEQMTPVDTWGKTFITLPTPKRQEGDFFRIVASENDTLVTYKCGKDNIANNKNLTLGIAGDYSQLHVASDEFCFISSDKSILITQFLLSQKISLSDTSLVVIPPIELYDTKYKFSTIEFAGGRSPTHYLSFVVKYEEKSGLRLNGEPLSSSVVFHRVPGTDFGAGFIQINKGYYEMHHISPISVFTVVISGHASLESYVIAPGYRLPPINTVCISTTSEYSDGLDNDCDGLIDEELCHAGNMNQDDDGDGRIDEDCAETPPSLCRADWYEYDGSCYFFSFDRLNFDSAKSYCESVYGKLAEPKQENHIGFLTETILKLGPREEYFIGGSDQAEEKSWVWVDSGEIITTSNWNPGQPDDYGGGEDCLHFWTASPTRKWNDVNCFRTLRYICEVPRPVIIPKESGDLECILKTSITMDFTFARVSWFFDNKQIHEVIGSYNGTISSTISVPVLPWWFGVVKCSIEGLDIDNTTLVLFNGYDFEIGIKTESEVTIEKGSPTKIGFHMTAPYVCQDCQITLRVVQIEAVPSGDICKGGIGLVNTTSCDVTVEISNSTQQFFIKHVPGRGYGVIQNMFTLQTEAVVVYMGTSHVKTVTDKTTVNVIQKEREWKKMLCTAYCDPHMTTFDGVHYEHQQKGTYYLYRNKAFPMEVQMKLVSCNRNRAFCPCGVAIRAGGDVFMMNFCNRKTTIDFEACESSPVLQVEKMKNNRDYLITMPTGTTVGVRILSMEGVKLFNVKIRPSVDDVNQTEGLCGTLNNDCSDDFTTPSGRVTSTKCFARRIYGLRDKTFSNSWEVLPENDLFNKYRTSVLTLWPYGDVGQICMCTTEDSVRKQSCDGNPYQNCIPPKSIPVQPSVINRDSVPPGGTTTVVVPEIPELIEKDEPDVDDDDVLVLNETEAVEFCTEKIKSTPAFTTCSNVNGVDIEKFIEICAVDTYLTGSTLWVDNAKELLRGDCLDEIQMNETTPDPPGQDSLCPGLSTICSGNGRCIQGECECNDGFTMADCSRRTDTPPEITVIRGLCDSKTSNCTTISVYGPNVDVSGNVTCKLIPFYLTTQKTDVGEVIFVEGKAVTLFEIQCFIPRTDIPSHCTDVIVRGYNVSVGYSTTSTSTIPLRFYDYDSTCQTPSQTQETTTFSIQENTCFIEGQCVSIGAVKSGDPGQRCDPTVSQYKWTTSIDSPKIITTSDCGLDQSLLIGVTTASGAVVTLSLCFCCLFLMLFRRKQKRQDRSYESTYYKESVTDSNYFRKNSKAILVGRNEKLDNDIQWSNGIYDKDPSPLKNDKSIAQEAITSENGYKIYTGGSIWNSGINKNFSSVEERHFCKKCGSHGERCGSWQWVCKKKGNGSFEKRNLRTSTYRGNGSESSENHGVWLYRHIEPMSEGSSFSENRSMLRNSAYEERTNSVANASFQKQQSKSVERFDSSTHENRSNGINEGYTNGVVRASHLSHQRKRTHHEGFCRYCSSALSVANDNRQIQHYQSTDTKKRTKESEDGSEIWYSVTALLSDIGEIEEFREDDLQSNEEAFISRRKISARKMSDTSDRAAYLQSSRYIESIAHDNKQHFNDRRLSNDHASGRSDKMHVFATKQENDDEYIKLSDGVTRRICYVTEGGMESYGSSNIIESIAHDNKQHFNGRRLSNDHASGRSDKMHVFATKQGNDDEYIKLSDGVTRRIRYVTEGGMESYGSSNIGTRQSSGDDQDHNNVTKAGRGYFTQYDSSHESVGPTYVRGGELRSGQFRTNLRLKEYIQEQDQDEQGGGPKTIINTNASERLVRVVNEEQRSSKTQSTGIHQRNGDCIYSFDGVHFHRGTISSTADTTT